MNQEHRDALRAAARRRSNCPTCNNGSIDILDGKEVGGMPGIRYKHCRACGWTWAITRKQRKFKL